MDGKDPSYNDTKDERELLKSFLGKLMVIVFVWTSRDFVDKQNCVNYNAPSVTNIIELSLFSSLPIFSGLVILTL
jgi:hypothetical protein